MNIFNSEFFKLKLRLVRSAGTFYIISLTNSYLKLISQVLHDVFMSLINVYLLKSVFSVTERTLYNVSN